jgi:uncharacterized protein (DUF1800 family)
MPQSALPPLDQVDPARAWQPWEPDAKDPWDRKWAGHLYRRAAFGATFDELREAEKVGHQATLAKLLHGNDSLTSFFEIEGAKVAKRYQTPQPFRPAQPFELPGWWLYCMLHTGNPLREKMTLFWHNHFATSIAKVGSGTLMFEQNKLMREHALGKFGEFLLAMSKDPAMLKWLDSNSNIKSHPNENYAREVMELFSLGVGHYTEKDIREAARAFTGWHMDGEKYEFNAQEHDFDSKSVLGRTGKLDGGDIVEVLLEQSACAEFLVGKLYAYFVSETQTPPKTLIEPLCEQLRRTDYDIGALVRTMLSSRHFFSAHAYRQRIKSPVEFVVGAVRAATDVKKGGVPQQALVSKLDAMGQSLFAPPNVKGWPGAQAWLNTSTILARENFGQALAMGTLWRNFGPRNNGFDPTLAEVEVAQPAAPGARPAQPEEAPPPLTLDPASVLHKENPKTPEEAAGLLLDVYLPGGVGDKARSKLVAFLGQGKPEGKALDRRAREAVHAIVSMPEYQLA